jgi:hypothetical protein
MSRLIDADNIPWQTTKTIGDNPVEVKLVLKQSIDTMSTIKIVQCKECKWRGEYFSCPIQYRTDDDFFCKIGERRTE